MENFSKFVDSYVLSNIRQNTQKLVIDQSVAYENVKSFSPTLNCKVFKFEGNGKANGKTEFYSQGCVRFFSKQRRPQIYSTADVYLSCALLTTGFKGVNFLERKKCSSELVSAKDVHLSTLVDETDPGVGTSNAMHTESSMLRKISKDCDDFLWNSRCKPLLKTVEVRKGKKFVRMVPVSSSSQIDEVSASREKFTEKKPNKQVVVKNPNLNFLVENNTYNGKNRLLLMNSNVMSENSLSYFFHLIFKMDKRFSNSPIVIPNQVGSKISFPEIYRLCFLPEEDDIKVPYVWNNVPVEIAEEQEFSLKLDTRSISFYDKVKNSNRNFPDSKENEKIFFKNELSRMKNSNESKNKCEVTASLNGGLLNCQKILNHLDNTYKKVKEELFAVLLYGNRSGTKDFLTLKQSLPLNSVCNYPDTNRMDSSNIFETSIIPEYHELKINELLNSQADHLSTYKHNERYMLPLDDTCERTFDEDTSHSYSLKPNDNNSYVNSPYDTSASNECDDQFFTLPSEESLILFNDTLLRLQNTYEIVRKNVCSWLISKDTHQNFDDNTNCDSVESLIDKRSSISNGKCLMKFKARNSSTIDRKCYDSTSSDSTSSFGLDSHMETLEYSSKDGSESELDDSGSSLDGSFKQCNRADSRESMTSTDSDHSDEIPRFSLPSFSRRRNCSRFHISRTIDFQDKVSSKEWSWKSGATEFTVRCAQRERRLRSEVQDGIGIPEDLLRFNAQEEIGVPDNLKPEFDEMSFLNANVTKMI